MEIKVCWNDSNNQFTFKNKLAVDGIPRTLSSQLRSCTFIFSRN